MVARLAAPLARSAGLSALRIIRFLNAQAAGEPPAQSTVPQVQAETTDAVFALAALALEDDQTESTSDRQP